MIRVWLLISMIATCTAFAQQHTTAQWGAGAMYGIKFQLLSSNGDNYRPPGNLSFNISTLIKSEQENALYFCQNTGVAFDFIYYQIDKGQLFTINKTDVQIHPEVWIPTRNEKLKFTYGLGVNWTVYINTAIRTNFSNSNISTNLDTGYAIIMRYKRAVIPFVSAGLVYPVTIKQNDVILRVSLKQFLLNFYDGLPIVPFTPGSTKPDVALSYRPTQISIGATYFFKSKKGE